MQLQQRQKHRNMPACCVLCLCLLQQLLQQSSKLCPVQISALGRTVSLGDHDTEEEAAHAFDRAAINKAGRSAKTNYPMSAYENEITELTGKLKPTHTCFTSSQHSNFIHMHTQQFSDTVTEQLQIYAVIEVSHSQVLVSRICTMKSAGGFCACACLM